MKIEESEHLIQKILEQYEEHQDKFAEEMELAEGKKQYLRGYLAALEQEGEASSPDMEEQIRLVRSKYCEPILDFLRMEGSLYHGDLAERLDVSPSGLNAIIKKIQEAGIPLIKVDQIGKFKIYSLSEEMKTYYKTNHRSTKPLDSESLEKEPLFLPLQRFVEASGMNWKEEMNLLLSGEEEGATQQCLEAFHAFIGQMVELTISGDESEAELKAALKNDILIYLLDEYVKAEIKYEEYFHALKSRTEKQRDKKIIGRLLREDGGKLA